MSIIEGVIFHDDEKDHKYVEELDSAIASFDIKEIKKVVPCLMQLRVNIDDIVFNISNLAAIDIIQKITNFSVGILAEKNNIVLNSYIKSKVKLDKKIKLHSDHIEDKIRVAIFENNFEYIYESKIETYLIPIYALYAVIADKIYLVSYFSEFTMFPEFIMKLMERVASIEMRNYIKNINTCKWNYKEIMKKYLRSTYRNLDTVPSIENCFNEKALSRSITNASRTSCIVS